MTMADNNDHFLYWIGLPTVVWAGFGINSVIVYFWQLGGPVPVWLGVWGVACTIGYALSVVNGIRLMRRKQAA